MYFSKISLFSILFFLSAWSSIAQNEVIDQERFKALEYRNLGPTRGGRVTAVSGVTDRPDTYYMGSTGGGLWKSSNYGHSWTNISDGFFATGSIGAISVAPSDSKIIYVGTGSDGLRSNVITGKGMYKSTDAGKTWEAIGMENVGQIGAVEIHPTNPNIVYVAAIGQAFAPNLERGVYRTTDGGKSWNQILFVSDKAGAVDLELAPDDPNTIYAASWEAVRKPWTIISGGSGSKLFKSTDGGDNWKELKNGLPKGVTGKADFTVSAGDPNRVYVLVEALEGEGGVYRSDDRGENFKLVSTKKQLLDRPFYYCNLQANPKNPDVLYASATQFWKSSDAGKTWKRARTPHGDNHDLWINPMDTSIMIQSNDGGANVSRDGGKTWSDQTNQSTAELYQVEIDDQFPYNLYAGQQDNSTIMVPSLPPYNSIGGNQNYWRAVGGCETGPVVPKPGNPDIVYANCKGRFGVFNKKTGQEMQYYVGAGNMYGHNPKDLKFRFQRVAPIHVSPHDPDVVYHASQYLHKTIDDGKTWEIISPDLTAFTDETQVISGAPITRDVTGEEFYSTIYAVRESALEKGVIWVGANDGPVHVTRDGGKNWKDVTPSTLPKGGRVQSVEPSPHNPAKAYVAVYRYLLGDWHPYMYRTNDYGQTWTLLTNGKNGIPDDFPTRVLREDPDREGLLYAGTEFGMYVSFDDGVSWKPFQQNLPVTPITDIKVHEKDLVLSTMGRGFWILDDLSTLHAMNTNGLANNTITKPRDTYRMRYRGGGKAYPRSGVIVDYYLANPASAKFKIDILKGKEVLRTFVANQKKKGTKKDGVDMATGFYPQGAEHILKNKKGAHRFRWDMRHGRGKNSKSGSYGASGPMVTPGAYTIRMTTDQGVVEHTFNIKMDPRVKASGVSQDDLVAQEQLSLNVSTLLDQAQGLSKSLKEQKEKLEKAPTKENKNLALKKIEAIQNQLETAEGRYMQPKLIAQLRYLKSMLDRADQKPGKDAYDRYSELKALFDSLEPQVDKGDTDD